MIKSIFCFSPISGMGGYGNFHQMTGMDHFGFGSYGAMSRPDFGVIAEVNVNAGSNTFKIQSLGAFTDINQLAGRGLAVSNFFFFLLISVKMLKLL